MDLAKKFIHTKTVVSDSGTENVSWEVDIGALKQARGNDWISDYPQLIERDLKEMSEMFPRWILVGGKETNPASCSECGEYVVPTEGKMMCLACGEPYTLNIRALIWTGLLPVQISGVEKVERNIEKLRERGQLKLPRVSGFLLVPIRIIYPSDWPHSNPSAYYTQEFFESLGTGAPSYSHEYHMNGSLSMCLFSRWHEMSIRDVIQNRIAPHALAQVKLANGERPQKWFNE
ncbi:MAG: hypothetical protein Q8R29_02075 [bacterium]|nr:hypothetical protein [bacterium]